MLRDIYYQLKLLHVRIRILKIQEKQISEIL